MNILVINSGSSSIKYRLFNMPDGDLLTKGNIEKIGQDDSFISFMNKGEKEITITRIISDHQTGIEFLLRQLTDHDQGCLKNLNNLDAVGHRVGHGGAEFQKSIIIDEPDLIKIEKYNELAPLHNPPNIKGIRVVQQLLPKIKQVAVFDTSFHQTLPEHAFMYALPYSWYEKYGIRRFGFHGTSHNYVSGRTCKLLNLDIKKQKIISCHLGNGSSITAIDRGRSIDTSMGFTPLEGLIMGTRPGDVDIGILPYIMKKENLAVDSLNSLLNKESGLSGITGISSDMREIEQASGSSEHARLGLAMYCYRIKKYIGAYTAILNGLDILLFTGGIGENSAYIRREVCKNLDFLGIYIDDDLNEHAGDHERVISGKDSRITVMVVPTNEELMIAEEAFHLVSDNHQSEN